MVLVENRVERAPKPGQWRAAAVGDGVAWREQVRTGELSRAAIELSTGGVLRLSEFTVLTLEPPAADDRGGAGKIDFARGAAYFFSRSEEEADVETPTASLNIRGTEFVIEVDDNGTTTVSLIDGAVGVSNRSGSVDLASGEQAVVEPGRAPRKTAMLDAGERIQWFLYYPAIADPAQFGDLAGGDFGDALRAYRSGDLLEALSLLPAAAGSPVEHRFCAAVKLASGRIDTVDTHLRDGGPHPLVDSIRLLVDVVKGRASDGGIAAAPATPDGRLALSYALQSRRDLGGALAAAREAVALSPDFGFGWARVAELEFGFGRTQAAVEGIDNALVATPRNAQALALRGYLRLAENRVGEAAGDFEAALAVDPALGNAWLGAGLARFQQRRPLEAQRLVALAAAVEPNRAFLRSYLAKAFATNGRPAEALDELGLARGLDPGDPTAFLYQALIEQRLYRYNAGIGSLEESVRLNDNRSLFRSGFLLDKDRSVREANLASLYDNAGMTEAGLEEARRAVVSDYVNPSAHLFLSNSFDALRDPRRVSLRFETPWFNELLLANLLSPAGTALLPQNISQQEYTALFPADRTGLSARTRYRSDGEWLATGTARARFERSSVALDFDVFTSDGARPNNDVERYTGYLQFKHAPTRRDSLYLNFKFQSLTAGDLRQLYDPADYDPDYRVEQSQAPVAIAGYQHEWTPESRTLALGGVLTDDLEITDPDGSFLALAVPPNPLAPAVLSGFTADTVQQRETQVVFGEVQQLWSDEEQTFLFGARADAGSFPTTNSFSGFSAPLFPADPFLVDVDPEYRRFVGYTYYTRELVDGLWTTLGLAADWQTVPVNGSIAPVSDETREIAELLPKVGVVWTPDERVTARAGYARSLGGATFDESVRLEPTQVAGFTQSFRTLPNESLVGGLPSTLFDVLGASVLFKLPTRTYVGAEAFFRESGSEREIGVFNFESFVDPSVNVPNGVREELDYEEWGGVLYVNQLIGDHWAVGARYGFVRAQLSRSAPGLEAAGVITLSSNETTLLHQPEAYLIWNHPAGLFGRLNARFFFQENDGYGGTRPGDSWTQIDLSGGLRVFESRGALEIGVLNLTGDDYRFNPLVPLPEFPRERTFFVELRVEY